MPVPSEGWGAVVEIEKNEGNKELANIIPLERIQQKIYIFHGKMTMLDRDLAELYGVTTGNLNKAVKRNIKRFPADFMFQLTRKEHNSLIFQIGISKKGRGGTRKLPYVFTEHGVLMLSSVLNSERAVQVNIQVMRVFTKIKEFLYTNKELRSNIEQMRKSYNRQFQIVFKALDEIKKGLKPKRKKTRKIGF